MAGLNPVDDAQLTPEMSGLVEKFKSNTNYANGLKIFAHKQEVFAPIWSAYINLLENGKVERGLKELVRLKIAQNNDCAPYVVKSRGTRASYQSGADLTAEKIAAVDHYEVSEVLTRREKLALKFAEKLGVEPEALDDDFFALLRQEFTDPEIVELAHIIAVGVGFERFIAVWEPRMCAL